MPNLAQVMKEEISRLARKEVRAAQVVTRKETARLRKANADLRARVDQLEKNAKQIAKSVEAIPVPEAVVAAPASKQRISGKGVRSLRKRLKLTRAQFAQLANTTGQTVYNWEKQNGVLTMRSRPRDALLALRGIGIKDVKARLDSAPAPKATPKKKVAKKKAAKKAPAKKKAAAKKKTKKKA